MYRLSSLAGADSRVFGKQQVRLLRIYLSATTFLYLWGVTFTLFPVRHDIAYGNAIGGIIAVALGASALAYLAVWPDRLIPATVAAVAATPIVMAFHVSMTAEYVCLIAPMFLAMYLRAFHPPRHAWPLIAFLTGACVVAVALAPAPHVGVISFLIVAVAIIGAAESFGLLMRAMFTAACTDPLTGLLNRAGWEMGTADLLARYGATPVSVTVVALDIDGLKRLNDTYGHQAGDRRIADYARHRRQVVPRCAVWPDLGVMSSPPASPMKNQRPSTSSSAVSNYIHPRSAWARPHRPRSTPASRNCTHKPMPRYIRAGGGPSVMTPGTPSVLN